MALTTYSGLQAGFTSWLKHSLYADNYPDFITLFEATANRKLRTRFQETATTLNTTNGAVALPTDFLAVRRVTWNGSSKRELEYVAPDFLQAAFPTNPQDVSQVYTIEASTMRIRPIDDSTDIILLYVKTITALSSTNTTNWLLTSHPDLYLFGSLVEAEAFGVNDERMPMWKARRDEIFDELNKLSPASRGIGGIRVLDVTP